LARKKPAFLQRMAKDPSAEVMTPAVRSAKNTGMGKDPDAMMENLEKSTGKKRKKK